MLYQPSTWKMRHQAAIATAQGRRKLKVVLGRGKYPQLAEIDFTFMSLKVCKALDCQKRYALLTCHVRWINPAPLTSKETKSLKYTGPPERCTRESEVAAVNNM